jgi:hypothetical protein
MTGPLLALALAAAEILLPPWPLSVDGEPFGFRGEGVPTSDGAAIEPIAPGLFRVVPAPGATSVTLHGGGAEATAAVEPPAGTVEIALRGPPPVKGRDPSVEIELAVRRAGGEPDGDSPPPSLAVSAGAVRGLEATGPGRFRAVYEPARTRHPEVAVIVALVPRCPLCPTPRAVGFAVVPLSAAVNLPGESRPRTRTTVKVGDRTFGPADADARGRFSIPIVIPPGARVAAATTLDALGNRKETTIDLRLPEVNRLACSAWPRAIPADGRSEASIFCVASGERGLPADGARLTLSASKGTTGPLAPVRAGSALQRARFRAPRGGGGGDVVLSAAYPEAGAASRDEVRVSLATGAPARIVARVPEPVPHGSAVVAETEVRDARGDLVARPSGPPGATVGFVAPDRFVAAGRGVRQEAPLSVALPPGDEAATLVLRPGARGGWIAEARTVDARPAQGIEVRFGDGAVARTDARGEARTASAARRETAVAARGARAAGWIGIVPPPDPVELATTVPVALRPPAPVDVTASVDGRSVRWRVEGADGKPLRGRKVLLRSPEVELGPPERDGDGGRAAIVRGRGFVAVVDAETGIAAVVEVQ